METAAKRRLAFQDNTIQGRHQKDPTETLFVISAENSGESDNKNISRTVLNLEQRLKILRSNKNLDPKACAEEVLSIVRDLVRAETGSISVDFELPNFFAKLSAESAPRSLVNNLLYQARTILSPRAPKDFLLRYAVSEQLAQISFLIEWYAARKAALRMLEERCLFDPCVVAIQGVMHDCTFLGERGFEVSSVVKIEGYESQSLWLSLVLFANGVPVSVRKGWNYWADDSELFVAKNDVANDRDDALPRFASIIPIIPEDQRAIYHAVKLFVPYNALAIDAELRCDIDCEVSLLSSVSKTLAADANTQTIVIPRARRESLAIPSYNTLGFWPVNPATGDSLSLISVKREKRIDAKRESYQLLIESDLTLLDKAGERFTFEVRFLTTEGRIIESDVESYTNRDGTFLLKGDIRPTEIVSRFPMLRCEVPMIALDLDPGRHQLLVEVVVLDNEQKILCGDVQSVAIEMPMLSLTATEQAVESFYEVPTQLDSAICIAQVHIDSMYLFNRRHVLRIIVDLFDDSPQNEILQAQVVIGEVDDYSVEIKALAQGLTIARQQGKAEHRLVYTFDCEQVLDILAHTEGDRTLPFRFELLDQRGCEILTTKRIVSINPDFGREQRVPSNAIYARGEVEIVDLLVNETPQRGGEVILSLTNNYNLPFCETGGYTLFVQSLHSSNKAMGEKVSTENGFSVDLVMPKVEATQAAHFRALQEMMVVRLPASIRSLGGHGVKIMLFAPSGRLLQVVYYSFLDEISRDYLAL